jgi:hypothetical protein
MNVFTGIVGISIIYAIWANTYFFSWFGVYDNPQDIIKMRGQLAFTLIPGGFLLVPLLYFCMAFVNTFSLMHNK